MIARPLSGLVLGLWLVMAGPAPPSAAAPGAVGDRAGVAAEALTQRMRLEAARLESLQADLAGLAVERRTIRLSRWVLGRLRAVPPPSWARAAGAAQARLLARQAARRHALAAVAPDTPALARAMLRQAARGAASLARRSAWLSERIAELEAAAGLVARERAATRREHERAARAMAQLAWSRDARRPERLVAGPSPPPGARGLGPGDGLGHGLARSCSGRDHGASGGC